MKRRSRSDALRGPGWLWIVAFSMLFVAMAAAMLMMRAPGLLDRPLTDPHPSRAAQVRPDPAARAQVVEILEVAGRARLDADAFTQLVRPWHDRRLEGLGVSVSPAGNAVFDISLREGASWINVHLVCTEVELANGRFTRLQVRTLELSGWDLTPVWGGKDLADRANQELDAARDHHPATRRMLDGLQSVRFVQERFWVESPRGSAATAFAPVR